MNSSLFVLLLLAGVAFSKPSMFQTADEKCAHCFSFAILEVCGTDGKTYINPCELRRASCLARKENQSTISRRHFGRCNFSLA